MARRFFDPQNSLWHWIGKVPELFCLSFFWLILCVPVITVVPATVALYDAIVRKLRPDEKGLFRRFFVTFWKELGRGILMSLLWLVVFAFLGYCHWLLKSRAEESQTMAVLSLVYQITLLIPVAVFFWAVALESRFYYSFWQLHKNALLFALSYLPRSALVLLIALAAAFGCWYFPGFLLILPAIIMTLQSIPLDHVMVSLMPEET